MDSKKILVIAVVAIVAAAAIGIVLININKNDDGELKVSYLKKNGYETQMVADEKGFFKQAGVNVNSIPVTGSGQDAVNLLLSGDVDIAATGEGPVANTLKNYPDDTVIVCGANIYTGGHVWVSKSGTGLVTYTKSPDNKTSVFNSFKDASGSGATPVKIGVQQGSTTESELKSWIKAMGLNDYYNDFGESGGGKYITLVNLKANTLVSALSTGDIDVLAASQPYPSQALAQIPDSYSIGSNADIDSYSVACYITTKEVYNEKKELIEKFIKGIDIASKYMVDNREECVNICAEVIGGADAKSTVESAFDIAHWKAAWSDDMAETLYKTCQKKKIDSVTLEDCKDKCLFLDYMATL